MTTDIEAIRLRHHAVKVQTGSKTNGGPAEYGEACGTCFTRWPCEPGVLLAEIAQLQEDAEHLRRHVGELVGRKLALMALCDQTDADPTTWVGAYFAVPTSEIRRALGVTDDV